MSGHNKWTNIKHTKEKADAVKGKLFTQIGKLIAVAVKEGGADPANNAKLRDCIAKAKAANMPNDNINRSIKKASGDMGNINYVEMTYEGYGPAGSAIIVTCLTDNKNRTAGDIRHLFDKAGGSLGSNGCVSYMFDRTGVIIVEKSDSYSEDDVLMTALEAEADDVETCDTCYEVYTSASNLDKVREALEKANFTISSAEVEMIAQNYIDLPEDKYEQFSNFIDKLEENDDVQDVYHNVNMRD